MCPVCEKTVIDEGRKSQDSVFYEGSYQAWLYRCCAGLTRTRFAEPFYCPSCASDKHTHELAELKCAVAALVMEVEQLKSSVHPLSSTVYSRLREMSERGLRLCKRNASPRSSDKPKVLTSWKNGLGNGPASATNDSPELENTVGALASKHHLPKRKKSLVQGEFGEP